MVVVSRVNKWGEQEKLSRGFHRRSCRNSATALRVGKGGQVRPGGARETKGERAAGHFQRPFSLLGRHH